jgi:hypothetical protein
MLVGDDKLFFRDRGCFLAGRGHYFFWDRGMDGEMEGRRQDAFSEDVTVGRRNFIFPE